MTDLVQIALISACSAAIVGVIPGITAAFSAAAARRAAERSEKLSHETLVVTEKTGKAVDGRLTEMLELTRQLAFAAGIADQKERSEAIASALKDARPVVVLAQPITPEALRPGEGKK